MLRPHLPSIDDAEGENLPEGLPAVVDAHVHIFPENIFSAIWSWFDENAWPIRYRLTASGVFDFLLSHGIRHIIALHYAHKPGIARRLNQYMAKNCREHPDQVTGLATLFPGEEDAEGILREAFDSGLKGVKLHAHVQCFDMNSHDMDLIYDLCQSEKKVMVMHVGREPKSPAYPCDPHLLCRADKLERVLKEYPQLKVCVPHLGADEFEPYRRMIEKHDNLWLDSTMMLAEYLPMDYLPELADFRSDRIMFGTDFPNLPYAWDREIKRLARQNLAPDALAKILGRNAVEFYKISCEET